MSDRIKRPWIPPRIVIEDDLYKANQSLLYLESRAPEMAELLVELTGKKILRIETSKTVDISGLYTIVVRARQLLKEVGYEKDI